MKRTTQLLLLAGAGLLLLSMHCAAAEADFKGESGNLETGSGKKVRTGSGSSQGPRGPIGDGGRRLQEADFKGESGILETGSGKKVRTGSGSSQGPRGPIGG